MCAADGSWPKGNSQAAAGPAKSPMMGLLRKKMPAMQAAAMSRAPQTASRATGLFGSSMLTGGSTLLGG